MSTRDPKPPSASDLLREIEEASDEPLPELDERWTRLVEGRATAEEREELAREAETSELAALALAALEPLPPETVHRIATFAPAWFNRPLPTPSPKRRWWWLGLSVGAFAAGGLLVLRSPADLPAYEGQWTEMKPPELRPLAATAATSTGCARPEPTAPRLSRGWTFVALARPATEAGRRPEVALRVDGQPVEGLGVRVLDVGSVRVEGRIGEGALALDPGWHCLVITLDPGAAASRAVELGFWTDNYPLLAAPGGAEMRQDPDDASVIIERLPPEAVVELLAQRTDRSQVRTRSGRTGWIDRDALRAATSDPQWAPLYDPLPFVTVQPTDAGARIENRSPYAVYGIRLRQGKREISVDGTIAPDGSQVVPLVGDGKVEILEAAAFPDPASLAYISPSSLR